MIKKRTLFCAVFSAFILQHCFSPGLLRAFGQNKVISRSARWLVLSTRHFDLHYTPDAGPVIPRVAYYLEKAYRDVTGDLGIEIARRTPFFFYTDHNRFEENNIADVGEGTGGVTEAYKNRFLVYHNGTEFWLEHVITHEFVHVAQFEVLYGGFWKSARLLKSPLYPLWFMEGLPEYETGNSDRVEEDLYLRDAATSGQLFSLAQLHGFNALKPHQVTRGYKQGAAAVRFLAQEYGRENVPALLKLLRDRFDVSTIVSDLTAQDFRQFDRRYLEYLTDYYAAQAEGLREPESYGRRLTPRDEVIPVFNTNPAFSPDGRSLAYVSDQGGTREVILQDLETGVRRTVTGRRWSQLEYLHTEGRALSFSPDGRWLAFAGEKEQRDYLYLYDLKRDRLRRVKTPFEQVRSPVFHPAEPRLAVVGMKGARNDLYEITPRGRLLRRLTEARSDVDHPAYSPDGRFLAYSLEKPPADDPDVYASTAAVRRKEEWPHPQRDLAALDLLSLSTAPLTDLPGDETYPAFAPDGKSLVFVGETDAVHNLYRLDLESGRAVQLTRVIGGNFAPAVAKDGTLAFSSFRRGSQDVYLGEPSLGRTPAEGAPEFALQPSRTAWPALAGRTDRQTAAGPPDVPASSSAREDGLFMSSRRPYRFRGSTDLFFPLFYYSSSDGLFIAALWQASEYLGNHQLGAQLQYSSGNSFLDYGLQYAYRRFRPQLFVQANGQSFFRDFDKTQERRESELLAGVSYPLDRFQRVEVAAGSLFREDLFDRFPQFNSRERENLAAASFIRDTTTGRYLGITAGSRFRATYQVARPVWNGTREYKSHSVEYHRFTPTGGERTLAFRGLAGVSAGASPQLFRLGGVDRLRGYGRNPLSNQASRFALGNLEWRVPLVYLDYRTGFLFPDFDIKAVYGVLFTDAGYDWSRGAELRALRATRVRHSVGAGLRLPTFILQTFPLQLAVDVAKRTDADRWVWYFSLGPTF